MNNNFKDEDFSTLVELLRLRAAIHPESRAYTFLINGEDDGQHLTYSELDQKARAFAALLQRVTVPGERAMLIYPPGLEFIIAFFGCLYAGVIAVPAYPPKLNRSVERIKAIANDAKPVVALTTGQILNKVRLLFSESPELMIMRWLATDIPLDDMMQEWQEPNFDKDTIAFIQYTSGSTGVPKGVMVSHGNIIYNERTIKEALQHNAESDFVGWLPLYHDMGLIGNVLQPFYIGSSSTLMSPFDFLQKPSRWLQAVSRYKAKTSGGPNFAYELCVQKVTDEEKKDLDLSSWTVAFNGAEPLRYETMERFAETFKACGFRKESFYPCYGLAEATLFVTGGVKLQNPVVSVVDKYALENNIVKTVSSESLQFQHMVSSGYPRLNQKVICVDPEKLIQLPFDRVGEIWVKGKSVAQGYWNRTEESRKIFSAHLSDTGEGPFLRTGDLGYIDDGEVYITGRLKDLIIIRGQNHYPQDIEITVETSHPSVKASNIAAFSLDINGDEKLIVVAEIDRMYRPRKNRKSSSLAAVDQYSEVRKIIESIKKRVAEEHQLQVYDVLLLKTGSIPKTSSGKIQRHECKRRYLDKTLIVWGA